MPGASDIVYQDENIAILDPNAARGILIFRINEGRDACMAGFYTSHYNENGVITARKSLYYPEKLVRFKAPFYNTNRNANLDDTYGSYVLDNKRNMEVIRVDPDQTFVYSVKCDNEDCHKKSKKTLSAYMAIIKANAEMKCDRNTSIPMWNLETSVKKCVPMNDIDSQPSIWSAYDIAFHSEIIAVTSRLPLEWFYSIYFDGSQCYDATTKKNINIDTDIEKKRRRRSYAVSEGSNGNNAGEGTSASAEHKYYKYKQKYLQLKRQLS